MNSEKRRKRIVAILQKSSGPVTGTTLSRICHVSRQIIVGDIAVLRAGGTNIISTPRGYQFPKLTEGNVRRVFVVCHGPEQMREELEAIVDNGGLVYNVVVEHEVYGFLEGALNLHSRRDVDQYMRRMEAAHAELLSKISGGLHSHLVEAESEADMEAIEKALDEMGVLYKQ